MRVWIWHDVTPVSDNYHQDGGLVIFAEGEDRARELAAIHNGRELPEYRGTINLKPDELDFSKATVMAAEGADESVFVFPDAGCC